MPKFSGPIPGESLTRKRGNSPWEQPPKYARIDEALKYYLEEFEDDEVLEDTLAALDAGLPLDLFVDSILLASESKGRHTPSVGMLLGPILHEYLLGMAESAGIDVIEFQSDLSNNLTNKDFDMFDSMFEKGMSDNKRKSDLSDALTSLPQASEEASEGEGYDTPRGSEMRTPGPEEAQEEATEQSTPNAPTGSGLIARP